MENAASLESLFSIAPWMLWAFVAFCGLAYFIYSYLFEILAQKLDAPRWMAWVPIVSSYLMFKLIGWERRFLMVVGAALLSGILMAAGPLAFLGMIVMIPTVIAGILLGLLYWPKLSMERGLSAGIGLLLVLPQFLVPFIQGVDATLGMWASLLSSVLGLGAFMMIVFHDGLPESGPHPVGYVLTGVGCLLLGVLVHTVPDKLMQDPDFQAGMQKFAAEMQKQGGANGNFEAGLESDDDGQSASALLASLASWTGSADVPMPAQLNEIATGGGSPAYTEPAPHVLAESCPDGGRMKKGPHKGGRATWCELLNGKQWVRHGPMRTWNRNGYVSDEGSYYLGQRSGTWTRYAGGGSREVQAEFRNGVQDGWMHRWDEQGEFVTAVFYENGEPSGRPSGDALAAQ